MTIIILLKKIKKKWDFQRGSRKTLVKFPQVLVFDLAFNLSTGLGIGISKTYRRVSHNFAEFPGTIALLYPLPFCY